MPGGDIINATNRSSDSVLGGAKPCIRSEGITPLGYVSRAAEASRSSKNGFKLRFISRVRKATLSPSYTIPLKLLHYPS